MVRIGSLAAVFVAALAATAQAASPIQGYWAHDGENVDGLVEVTPGGAVGAFKGMVLRRTIFGTCAHRAGEHMWQLADQADGTYRGTHVNYTRQGCRKVPGAHALIRVRKTPRGDVMDFCATPPEEEPPKRFTDDCHQLERVGWARDLSRMCATSPVRASRAGRTSEAEGTDKDVCVSGPAELRSLGCLRPRDSGRYGFVAHFRHRSASDDVAVRRRTNREGLVDRRGRIKSVTFKLDRRSRARDRSAPFRLSVRRARLRGGSHGLLADAQIVVPKTRTVPRKLVRRRVFFEFEVCV